MVVMGHPDKGPDSIITESLPTVEDWDTAPLLLPELVGREVRTRSISMVAVVGRLLLVVVVVVAVLVVLRVVAELVAALALVVEVLGVLGR